MWLRNMEAQWAQARSALPSFKRLTCHRLPLQRKTYSLRLNVMGRDTAI